jgi:glucosamine 6-phosphate synthetase-like amidotransferase/phosphosugar isomerase protein
MCGIFGFALSKPLPMTKIFAVLQRLEVHQYPQEPRPVGGHGAGIAYVSDNGNVQLEKVGAVTGSPARHLAGIVHADEASVLVAHVRMPSPEFMETAKFKETAQPFLGKCTPDLTVVSAHNGKVANYEAIRKSLCGKHLLESENIQLIDSEVIPHLFEDLLKQEKTVKIAVTKLFLRLEGSNTISLLHAEKGRMFLHFIHKGETRGLTVWTNKWNEVMFCSRKEPLMNEFKDLLDNRKFEVTISIPYRKDVKAQASFALGTR